MSAPEVRFVARLAELGGEFKPGERWRCGCDREHGFGPYAAAHWGDVLDHKCTTCGAERSFLAGRVVRFSEKPKHATS